MKAIYNFQKIGFKLKALLFTMILLASFNQVMATDGTLTVTSTVNPGVICLGSSTTVVGNIATSPIDNGTTILWTWVGAGGTYSTTTTASHKGDTESASLLIYPTVTGSLVLTVSEGTYSGTATTAVVTVTPPPSATISYTDSPYCTSLGSQSVYQTGTTGGTYTSTSGLNLNTSTGAVTPSSSTAGTYIVSYIVTSACPTATFTTSVTITQLPTSGTISYTTPVCSSAGSASVTHTGGNSGGTYSIYKVSGSGTDATINASSGLVSFPDITTEGNYTITYTLAASGGCATVTTTASLVITKLPAATISYAGTPFCKSVATPQEVTRTGTTGGTYTSTSGLNLNTSNGDITPSTSTAGNYTVSYIIPAAGGCATVTATTPVTITTAPVAPTITYTASPVCASAGTATVTQTGGTSGGIYTITPMPTGVTINSSTGTVSFLSTNDGTYSVTYTINASGGCATVTTTTGLVIDKVPSATAGGSQSICSNGTATVSGASATNYSTIAWTENGAGSITAGADTFTPTYTAASGDAGNTVTLLMTVTGSSSGCGTVTATATYSVLVVGSTVITANPVDQTICEGSTASFTVATAPTLPAPSYQWYVKTPSSIAFDLIPVGAPYSGTTSPTLSISPTTYSMNTYQYECRIYGCGDPKVSLPATLTVNPLPTAAAGGTQTICSNATATVSGASATNYSTIAWTENGAGSITAGASTFSPTYTAAVGDAGNTVTLTMTVTGTGGCTATATATYSVVVNALPTAAAGGTQTICSNATATVSGASSSGGTVLWTHNGAGTLNNRTTVAPTYFAAAGDAGHAVTLLMTVTNTCATPLTATATYTVNVAALPTAAAGGSATICQNGSVTVSGASATNYSTILWTKGTGAGSLTNAGTLTPTYTAAAGDAGTTVTLLMTVTGTGGCSTATTTATYTVNVTGLPTATAGGSADICHDGFATVYGASATNYSSILWTKGTGLGTLTNAGTLTPTYTAAAGDAGHTVTLLMTVTGTAGCGTATATATFTVNVAAIPTATITAGGSTTFCAGGSVTLTASTGTSYLWSNGLTTQAITATSTGSYTVTVFQGTCSNTSTPTTVTVKPAPVVTADNSPKPLCLGATLALIATPDLQTQYSWSGPNGFTNVGPNSIITLNNVSSANEGVYYVTVLALNGCSATASTTVTITPPIGTLSTPSGPTTLCQGASPTTYSASASNAVTYFWSVTGTGNTITTGTASAIVTWNPGFSGTAVVSVYATGCGTTSITSTTVTVNPTPTVVLASGSASQTVCNNVAITPFAYTVGGSATGAGVTGLPTGVSGTFTGTTLTVTGTPSVTGTFNYTVTSTGGSCGSATATGTITVTALPNIILASGSASQTVCNNVAVTPIAYTVGGSATGAGVSGLPSGVSGTFSGTTYTISGTPTASGTFNYTVTTTGGCSPAATATGTITVTALPTVVLASGSATQTVCNNVAITPIAYTVGGSATGAGVTGLPTGVSGTFSGTTYTINGTPTASGTFNFTVTTTGGSCGSATSTGTITVNALPTIVLSSAAGTNSQTVTVNTAITTIAYTVGGSATGAGVIGLPTGVSGTFTGTTFTITGTPTATGTFTYTVTTTGGACSAATATGTIKVNPLTGVIAGYVTYDNTYATGLNNVNVYLKNPATGSLIATAVTTFDGTGNKGYYTFTGIVPGNYRMVADFPTGVWGGNNATDALIVNLYTIGSWPLYYLKDTVADVNASHSITPNDALYIKLRVVDSIHSYPAGDWKFTDTTFTQLLTSTVNLKGLCVGDVNGSYASPFKAVSFLSAVEDEVMTVPVNKSFSYDIRSTVSTDLGAMTLFMNYDPSLFTIDKMNSSLEGLAYKIENGRLALAWSNSNPLKVKTDGTVISLKMTAKVVLPDPTQIFTIDGGSEFADPLANRIDNFDLKMAKVITTGNNFEFSMVNNPNPFKSWTDIVYTIPEAGKVKLVITNLFGQQIKTLVDEQQAAGVYKVRIDPAEGYLQPGLYLYSIVVDGVTTKYSKTNKMLFSW